MTRRLTFDDVARMPEHVQRQVGKQLRAQPSQQNLRVSPLTETAAVADKRRVRGVKRTVVDGIKFMSLLEARRWQYWKTCVAGGMVKRVHRQVIFDLPGPSAYICDFGIVENDDRVHYEDAKGYQTDMSRLKIKQVRDIYGVEVKLWQLAQSK